MSVMNDLINQYKLLHAKKKGYGSTGENQFALFSSIVQDLNPSSILDHGCGKSRLASMLADICGAKSFRYDPAIPGIDSLPAEKIDLVLSTDVAEHVPEMFVSAFFASIRAISSNALFAISLRPSGNVLPDGRPCHLTVKPKEWWISKLKAHYSVVTEVLHDTNAKKVIYRTF